MLKRTSVQSYVDRSLEYCLDNEVGLEEGSELKKEYDKSFRPVTNLEAHYMMFACWLYDNKVNFDKEIDKLNEVFGNSRQCAYDVMQKHYLLYIAEEYLGE